MDDFTMRARPRRLGTFIVLLLGALLPASIRADELPTHVLRTRTFVFPVMWDDDARANIDKMHLYVKSAKKAWARCATIGPKDMVFSYELPDDGVYFFLVQTIARGTGAASPADLASAAPQLKVVIDTKTPAKEPDIKKVEPPQALPPAVDDVEQPKTRAPATIYTSKRAFNLPVKLAAELRAGLKEFRLYFRSLKTDWAQYAVISPDADKFTFKADSDGEYSFIVQTVNREGTATPADLSKATPALKIVIDTVPPMLEVKGWKTEAGESFLKCDMVDDNPDPASIKLTCRTAKGEEIAVPPVADKPGLFRILPAHGEPIRLNATDRCQNETILEVNWKELLGKTAESKRTQPNRTDDLVLTQFVPPAISIVKPKVLKVIGASKPTAAPAVVVEVQVVNGEPGVVRVVAPLPGDETRVLRVEVKVTVDQK